MTRKVENKDRIVDQETGEQLTTKKDITITSEEEFFLVFLSNLGSLYKLKNATEIHVLAKMCSIAMFNTNTVMLPSAERKNICDELDITNTNLTNILRSLKLSGAITGENGKFTINPDIMWKGSTKAREKWLKSDQGLELRIKFKQQTGE
jgi:uncharacterized protein YrrD